MIGSFDCKIKRLFDVAVSLLALSLLIVPIALLALIIKVSYLHPVFFFQLRPGEGGRPFLLVKFCTMNVLIDKNGDPLSDEYRLTSFGVILRRWSVDEIPELWNVLKGEMSLVGPRPLLLEYLGRYNEEQARRHDVKPGITGWAQVQGRNEVSWSERFIFDTWYIDNWSLRLDMKIIAMTLNKWIKREGINQPGSATMAKFFGEGGSNGRQIR